MEGKDQQFRLIFLIMVAVFISACAWLPRAKKQTAPDTLYTRVVETLYPKLTLSAGETAVSVLTETADLQTAVPSIEIPFIPSESAAVIDVTNTPFFTQLPSATSTTSPVIYQPTRTPVPVFPTATVPAIPCDWISLVAHVNVPDGMVFLPGAEFTKIWRIRNIGTCTWNPSYSIIFVTGERMYKHLSIQLQATVRPGESIDLSVPIISPSTNGRYRAYWMLSNNSGRTFGLGEKADSPFWVEIQVASGIGPFAYDFSQNMCTAMWQSSAGLLPCPGGFDDSGGFVNFTFSPILENGKRENKQTIWIRPQAVQLGWITGKYPLYMVKRNDRFVARIGCLEGSTGCDVIFHLRYQVPGEAIKTLGTWHEVYDGKIMKIEMELSDLAGQQIHFIISVENFGMSASADVFWLAPSIQKITFNPTMTPTNTPKPTKTPTSTPTSSPTPTSTETTTTGLSIKTINPNFNSTKIIPATHSATPASIETLISTPTPDATIDSQSLPLDT